MEWLTRVFLLESALHERTFCRSSARKSSPEENGLWRGPMARRQTIVRGKETERRTRILETISNMKVNSHCYYNEACCGDENTKIRRMAAIIYLSSLDQLI